MHYGITRLATNFTEADIRDWRVRLLKTLFFFVPRANPDIEPLFPRVACWALELDTDGWPVREIGLDCAGAPLFRSPDGRNSGFWPDMARQQFDLEQLEHFSESEFNQLWSASAGA